MKNIQTTTKNYFHNYILTIIVLRQIALIVIVLGFQDTYLNDSYHK